MTRAALLLALLALASPALAFEPDEDGRVSRPRGGTPLASNQVRVLHEGELRSSTPLFAGALRSFEDCPEDLYYALPRSVHKELVKLDYSKWMVLAVAGQAGERILTSELVTTGTGIMDGAPVLHVLTERRGGAQETTTTDQAHLLAVRRGSTLGFGGGWRAFDVNFGRVAARHLETSGTLVLKADDTLYFRAGDGEGEFQLLNVSASTLNLIPEAEAYKRLLRTRGMHGVRVAGHATPIRPAGRLEAVRIQFPPLSSVGSSRDRLPVEWTLQRGQITGVLGYRDRDKPFSYPQDSHSEGQVTLASGREVLLFTTFEDPGVREYTAAFRAGYQNVSSTLKGWYVRGAQGAPLNRFYMLRATVQSEAETTTERREALPRDGLLNRIEEFEREREQVLETSRQMPW